MALPLKPVQEQLDSLTGQIEALRISVALLIHSHPNPPVYREALDRLRETLEAVDTELETAGKNRGAVRQSRDVTLKLLLNPR